MSAASIIKSITRRGQDANQSARELAVELVEGENIPEATVIDACRDAGISLEAFAAMLETLQARKDAFDEYHARDYDAEVAEAQTDYRKVMADKDAVAKELEVLRAEFQRLNDLCQSRVNVPNRIRDQQQEARRMLNDALAPNTRDWRLV